MSGTSPARHNRSFLADFEQVAIRWILPRIPREVSSLRLTTLGMAGSLLCAVGLIGCNFSYYWLVVVVAGVTANWFGDSLDGSLARFRSEERPRFGFLVDHTCDLFSQIVIIVAFGLSPFLSLVSALVVLLCYLLFSAYTYIRAATQHLHQMAYIGVGATEFRILMIAYACGAAATGVHEKLVGPFSTIDVSVIVMAAMAVVGLGFKAVRDAREVSRSERGEHPTVEPSDSAIGELDKTARV